MARTRALRWLGPGPPKPYWLVRARSLRAVTFGELPRRDPGPESVWGLSRLHTF